MLAQTGASQQDERLPNKGQVSPDSIAEAFVQAYSGRDVDALADLYAARVDHTNSGVISNAAIEKQAREYFALWPVRQWTLAGPVKTTSMGPSRQKITFSASYDASNPQTKKHASGIATETLIVASDASGAMKIISQQEQTSKKSSSQSGEETAGDLRLNAAKAEHEHSSHDEAARIRYVTKLADIYKAELGGALAAVDVGHELRKHPMPRNVDSTRLSQLLIGEWDSPRHTYSFRADGTYGISDEQRDRWRIDGNEYIDDVSRGPIILLDRNYFIYADGQGAAVYTRAKASAETADTQEFEAAKQEYEQSSHDESARSAYVSKLAKIRDRQIQNYWKTGDKNFDSATAVNEELRKHPAPANSDPKKLSQLLIGRWQSPRRIYAFRANGKWGSEDGPGNSHWRIIGNQLIEDGSRGTIVLINTDYFIYTDKDAVFFHARVRDN